MPKGTNESWNGSLKVKRLSITIVSLSDEFDLGFRVGMKAGFLKLTDPHPRAKLW